MAAEVIGGLMPGSLAPLANAAHMLTDAGGLAFALLAIRLGERPATPRLCINSPDIHGEAGSHPLVLQGAAIHQ